MTHEPGKLVEPAERRRPDGRRRGERLAQARRPARTGWRIGAGHIEPANVATADQFDVGASLAQQRRPLAGTLPAPDDRDAPAAPVIEARVVAGVTDQLRRKPDECGRPEFLLRETGRDHYP